MYINKTTGTEGVVIFDTILEDFVGGAILNVSRLKTDTKEVKAGTPVYVADGVATIVKTAVGVAGGTAIAPRVAKNHEFKVGDVVALTTGGDASAITDIVTTHADYDTLTIATLGATVGAGDMLIEAAVATTGDDAALLYTPNGLLHSAVDVSNGNPSCSVVVRGSAREDALPYPLHALVKSALPLIRFV